MAFFTVCWVCGSEIATFIGYNMRIPTITAIWACAIFCYPEAIGFVAICIVAGVSRESAAYVPAGHGLAKLRVAVLTRLYYSIAASVVLRVA
jgi:chromate transport protein ChrA